MSTLLSLGALDDNSSSVHQLFAPTPVARTDHGLRPALAHIDLGAIRDNYRLSRQYHGSRVLAVLKANAYGHGATQCARALAPEADGFAVAFLDEALELRAAGITQPILLLEGVFDAAELQLVVRHDLWTVVHHAEQIRMLETTRLEAPVRVWLKIDSGMGRAGFSVEHATAAWRRLHATGKLQGDMVLMSHFACADELENSTTTEQIRRFDEIAKYLPGPQSLANSAGLLGWPAARRDWGRAGLLLYGARPIAGQESGLRPAMTLTSRVMAVRDLPAGASLGYASRFIAKRPTRVGLVALGYADGYPARTPDGTPVAVDGIRTRLIGRVSMDMLTVDLTDLPAAGPGSHVELWGNQVTVDEVARSADTTAYELLCNVKRVRIEYSD